MAEKINVPEIRFAGFVDPWEQRKLGELLLFQNGFNGSSESFGSGIPLISVMDVLDDEFITHETVRGKARLNYEEASRYCVEYGDVLFQRSSENQEDAGTSNVYLDQHVPSAFGGFVIRGKKVDVYNPIFIKYLLGSSLIREQITHRAQGAQHINVSQDTLADVVLLMPSMREQEAVGLVFLHLANLITLHQRERRKAPFSWSFAWEQRKLGDFGSVAMCKRIYKEQTSEQGDVPFFKIGTFGAEPDAFISNELFEDFRHTYPYPAPGTLLISAAGSIGRVVEYQGEKAYFQDSNIVWLEHDHRLNDAFLKPLYSQIEWGLEGSTIKRLYNKDLLSAEVTIPDDREQKVIGQFFAKLDNLITLHQREPQFTNMGYMRVERALMTMSMSLFSSS